MPINISKWPIQHNGSLASQHIVRQKLDINQQRNESLGDHIFVVLVFAVDRRHKVHVSYTNQSEAVSCDL